MSSTPATFAEIAPWLALALFGFTFFWCFVTFVLSRMSGWATLATAYPAGEVMTPNVRWRWQSALMNANTKYNGALTIVADAQAVHCSVFLPLRTGHDPFSAPWQDIRTEIRHVMFSERIALSFARAPNVTMLVSRKLAERLATASLGRLVVPPGDSL